MRRYFLLLTIVCVCNLVLQAEDSIMYNYDATIPSYVSFETGDSVVRRNQKALRRPLSAKQILCRYLPLNAETLVAEVDTVFDEFGDKHIRFEQRYNGVKVDGQRYYLHYDGVDSKNMNGNFRAVVGVNTTPAISESVALDKAVEFLDAEEYAWENDTAELFLRDDTGDSLATYYPHGELVIMFDSVQMPKLVYKFKILTLQPSGSFLVYINAQNGVVELAENLLQRIGQYTGTADTRFYGTRNIITDRVIGKYRLHDHSRGHIITRNMRGKRYATSSPNYYDNDNNWTAAEYHANKDDAALTAHWAAEMTYDYFKVKFGRKGWDGKNGLLRLYINAPLEQYKGNNAYWDGWGVTCGIGSNQPYVALDIIAHEIGHAIKDKTANFKRRGESGALNEGFSDIWGACVKYHVLGESNMWHIGEIVADGRHLDYPKASSNPDTYKGKYWRSTMIIADSTDYGGVHRNSTVFSHWFYLLAQGGTGMNDNEDFYSVDGVGIDKAARITYNMLTSGLTENSDFADARRVAIDKAKSYGTSSHELIAVQNAWYAVGVGAPYVEIEGEADICDGEYEYALKNCPHDATIRWTTVNGLHIVDSTRTSIVVERLPGRWVRKGFVTVYRPAFTGTARLKAEIIKNGIVVSTGIKSIEVHSNYTPEIERDTTKSLYIRIPQSFSVTNFSEEDSLNLVWKVIKPNGTKVNLGAGLSKTYIGTTTGTHQIVVTNTGGCEPDNTTSLSFTIMLRKKRMVYGNPASYSVDITILEQDEDEITLGIVSNAVPYDGEYTLELWSELYGRVRTVEADAATVQIPLSGLNAGTYFLKLIINDEPITTQQLIIK